MNFIKNENGINFLFLSIVTLYISYFIFSNLSKSFDLTDESFYILSYSFSKEMYYNAIALFRYPLAFLNYIVFDDLIILRVISVLLLLLSSIFLGYEYIKYINAKFNFNLTYTEKLNYIIIITLSSLAYYKLWLFTPSYNWLTLVSCILFYGLLFKVVNNRNILSYYYFLIGFIIFLSFLSKPTTTLVLVFSGFVLLFIENKKIKVREILLIVMISTIMYLFLFIVFIYEKLTVYLNLLNQNLKLNKLLESGHSFDSIFDNYIRIFNKFFYEKFLIFSTSIYFKYTVIGTLVVFIIFSFFNNKIITKKYFLITINTLFCIYIISLFYKIFLVTSPVHLLGFYFFEIIQYFIVLLAIYFIFINKEEISKNFKKIISIILFLLLGVIAYTFGTNTNIVYKLTEILIFINLILTLLVIFIDKKLEIKFIKSLFLILSTVSLIVLLLKGYEFPYRQKSVSNHNYEVAFLNKSYKLYVDAKSQKYINDLKELALKYKFEKTGYLLDLTGSSPGANVIINGKFFSSPWLIGGYKGSNNYSYEVLKKFVNTKELNNAWLLIAPNGKRRLDLSNLIKLGLNFPSEYKMVGSLKTSYNNEYQEVWIPKLNIKDIKND